MRRSPSAYAASDSDSSCEFLSRNRTADRSSARLRSPWTCRRCTSTGKTGCAHFRDDRVGRPEIGEITDLRLREIGVVQPVVGLLGTHIVEREPAAAPQHAKGLAQHACLVAEMVEGVLATDEVEAA